jgi:hypothetical protein
MRKSLARAIGLIALAACASNGTPSNDASTSDAAVSSDAPIGDAAAPDAGVVATQTAAFFYQDVTPTTNNNRVGITHDGKVVDIYNFDVLKVTRPGGLAFGDPVFSRLSNGRWVMTAWTGFEHPRGVGQLMLHESACPTVVEANVKVLGAKTATGCKAANEVTVGHTSQIFDANGSQYILHAIRGELYLTRLTDGTHAATDLQSLCVRETPAKTLADLAWGESTLIMSKTLATGLLLSDSGIARRKDGTWVVFVKGYPTSSGCAGTGLCELCARGIYRSTSTDLITWSTPVRMIDQASVPDAVTYPDGSVWVYWQDFSPACAAQNEKIAGRAPISGAYELADLTLSPTIAVSFPKEPFQTDTKLHFPTNGNPVALTTTDARAALEACLK